jgi:hypothetical protein
MKPVALPAIRSTDASEVKAQSQICIRLDRATQIALDEFIASSSTSPIPVRKSDAIRYLISLGLRAAKADRAR